MKKSSTKKPAASPAPATAKASKSAPVSAAAQKPVAAKSAPASKSARAKSAVKSAAPAVKAPAAPVAPVNSPAAAAFTVVTAQIDVGFGNTLYIRGEGPGLSWNKGLALNNARADQWTISLPRATRPIVFKFLLNDETWSDGEDYRSDSGASVLLRPEFGQIPG